MLTFDRSKAPGVPQTSEDVVEWARGARRTHDAMAAETNVAEVLAHYLARHKKLSLVLDAALEAETFDPARVTAIQGELRSTEKSIQDIAGAAGLALR